MPGINANSLQYTSVYEVQPDGSTLVVQLIQKGENQYFSLSLQERGDAPGTYMEVWTPYPPQAEQPQPEN